MNLTPAMERYILHWGEMGSRWGVNRSVAQVHALLYLADRPLGTPFCAGELEAGEDAPVSQRAGQTTWVVATRNMAADQAA